MPDGTALPCCWGAVELMIYQTVSTECTSSWRYRSVLYVRTKYAKRCFELFFFYDIWRSFEAKKFTPFVGKVGGVVDGVVYDVHSIFYYFSVKQCKKQCKKCCIPKKNGKISSHLFCVRSVRLASWSFSRNISICSLE